MQCPRIRIRGILRCNDQPYAQLMSVRVVCLTTYTRLPAIFLHEPKHELVNYPICFDQFGKALARETRVEH